MQRKTTDFDSKIRSGLYVGIEHTNPDKTNVAVSVARGSIGIDAIDALSNIGERVIVGLCSFIKNSSIGDGTRLEDWTSIEDSEVGADCRIGYNSVIKGSYIGKKVLVHNGINITGSNIGDGAVIDGAAVIEAGCTILPGVNIPYNRLVKSGSIIKNNSDAENLPKNPICFLIKPKNVSVRSR